MLQQLQDDAVFMMDARLFDGMRFFVTQCAMKTLHRIDDNQPHQPAYSDLILNLLMHVGGMVNECQYCALFKSYSALSSKHLTGHCEPRQSQALAQPH